MRLVISAERCFGSGICLMTAPGVFGEDEEGHVMLLAADADRAAAEQDVRQAVSRCPSGAIEIEEGS
jgi:ferredoxin